MPSDLTDLKDCRALLEAQSIRLAEGEELLKRLRKALREIKEALKRLQEVK